MFKCKKCGSEFTGSETKCPKCGEDTGLNTLSDSSTGSEKQQQKNLNKIVWVIVGATALIVMVAVAVLFLVILPSETEPQLSTPIGEFTYTQRYSNTFGQSSANSGYTLLIITFTPKRSRKTDDSSSGDFSMGDVQALLGDEKYDASIVQESFIEGKQSTYTLVYGVPKSEDGTIAEVALP